MAKTQRAWIDRLGVRMEEPRDRFVVGPIQVMTSVEYTGPHIEELLAFRAVLEEYFQFARDCRQQVAAGLPAPAVPESLLALFAKPAPKKGKTKAEATDAEAE